MRPSAHAFLVIVIFSISFIGSMAFRSSMPAVTFYARGVLEASALSIGLLTSSFFAARATFSVITGSLADRFGRRMVHAAAACFLLNGLAVQLYITVETVPAILGVRFLQGILNGVAWVSIQYILGRSVREEVRGRVYAIYFAVGSLGVVGGNLLYSVLSEFPIAVVLNASSILYVASALLTLAASLLLSSVGCFSIRVKSSDTRRGAGGLALTKAAPLMIIVLGVTFFSSIVRGDLIYIYISEVFDVSEATTAQAVALASFIALAGGYILSWVSDRFGDLLALKMALAIGVAGGLIMAAKILSFALAGLILFYIANSGIVPISRRIAVTRYRLGGTTLGLVNAAGNLGAVIGASVAGYLYDVLGYASTRILSLELTIIILIYASTLVASLAASIVFLRE